MPCWGQVPLDQAKILPPPRSLQHHLLTKLKIVPAGKGEILQYHTQAAGGAFGVG